VSSGIGERVRRANRVRRSESSIPFRVAVLGAVMTSATALAAEGVIALTTFVLVMVLFPVAYWVSYVRRDKDNWHIKIALALAAVIGLIRFMGQLRGVGSLDEIRFPLADLFLIVQIIHSFDLPARKDLNFSLGSSLTLMAVAASVSQTLAYAIFLLLYFAFAATALAFAHRSEASEDAAGTMAVKTEGKRTKRTSLTDIARSIAISGLAGALLFMVIPQTSNLPAFALPFSLGSGFGLAGGGGLINPGFLNGATSRSNAAAYYGFSERMDLRVRGDLPDDLVMRVRTSAPAMWKGTIFDRYDGDAWTKDTEAEPTLLSGDGRFFYPSQFRSLGPRAEVVQTFYIETEMPNAIIAASQPDEVWFNGPVSIDELGSLTTASTLTPGTVYSAISTRGAATPGELRTVSRRTREVPDLITRYLQLPGDLPARIEELARRVTRDATNDYDRVKAIESYLKRNYRYSLDSPVPPAGQDAVDHFLFETDVGFCEQFASATAVMLRTLGIPARVVVGYTPGDRNPFTGYHEVKASDAHSWIEVWFPNVGWYEFDPTFAIPPANPDLSETIPLAKAIEWIAGKVRDILPAGMGGITRAVLFVALAAVICWGAWLARRRLRKKRSPLVLPPGEVAGDGPIVRAFGRLEVRLAMRGTGRKPSETAAETMSRVADLRAQAARAALAALEVERYGPSDPPSDEASRAVAEIDGLVPLEPSESS
jgi:protein-glutamine gamma-glutamyltransferase